MLPTFAVTTDLNEMQEIAGIFSAAMLLKNVLKGYRAAGFLDISAALHFAHSDSLTMHRGETLAVFQLCQQ